MDRQARRLARQFDSLARALPPLRSPIARLVAPGAWPLRVPAATVLVVGGLLWFLPFFGLWMLPLGLLLLAVDVPRLRPMVTAALIRGRRWIARRRAVRRCARK